MSNNNDARSAQTKIIAENMRDIILGGQDGLVNVLGIVLGVGIVAMATNDVRIVLVAGLAATFAESFSMAAVAYTSTKAERDHFLREHQEAGKDHASFDEDGILRNPLQSALVVGLAALIGSFVPILPFFFTTVAYGIILAGILSAIALFVTGAIKAKLTIGNWFASGMEMMLIGLGAAFIGYLVGLYFNVTA